MRYLGLVFATAMFAAVAFTGCGKKGGNVAATAGPAAAPAATGPATCAAGQLYNPTYGCLDRVGCTGDQGWVPTIQKCEPATPVSFNQAYGGTAALRWGYPLKNIQRGTFETLMKEYGGFCGQWTWNLGTADCKTYSSAGYVIIEAGGPGSAELNITIGAGASSPSSIYDSWYMTPHVPMRFRAKVYPINESQGLEFRAEGLMGTRSWNAVNDQSLVGYIQTGRLTDQVLNVQLYYRGAKLGDAPVARY